MPTFSPPLKLTFTIRTRTSKKVKQTPWQREENEGWYEGVMLPRRKGRRETVLEGTLQDVIKNSRPEIRGLALDLASSINSLCDLE